SLEYFHNTTDKLYYDFPQKKRPFSIPEPMWPEREKKLDGYRKFDLVIVSDFRLACYLEVDYIKQLKSLVDKESRIGLVQLNEYEIPPEKKINTSVRDELEDDTVQMLVYGEKILCESVLILNPI
ncbi:hypothetical protein, partial [Pseudomonas sp. 2995-1]|uniref:hypothetical protein n=1 Tax=Pseudomonas sp. 2995-1 TaxID=1712679 RepID=UPI001C4835D9